MKSESLEFSSIALESACHEDSETVLILMINTELTEMFKAKFLKYTKLMITIVESSPKKVEIKA